MSKTLVIGDTHFKEDLAYADYIEDRRIGEKKDILDFVIKSSHDCDNVVFLGDVFDSKNPSARVIKDFVEFIERFESKEVYIISGNHSKKGDGTTALDFLKEIKGKDNWHIYTSPTTTKIGTSKNVGYFLPNMLKSELNVETNEEAVELCLRHIENPDILFTHHSITGTVFQGTMNTDTLNEIVLPKNRLEEKCKLIVAGHIHTPQQYGKVLITGSLFTKDVGEKEKFIYKISEDLSIEKLKVPAREIHKIENPTTAELSSIPSSAIIKAVITNKTISIEDLTEQLSRFDASLIIEDYPDTRVKAHVVEGAAFDFSLEALLKLYSEEKKVDLEKLLNGLSIING